MNRIFSSAFFALPFSIATCLTSCGAGYAPRSFGGGFSDIRVDSSAFIVTYQGTGIQTKSDVDAMALLRSADLTKKYGYLYFDITESQSDQSISAPGSAEHRQSKTYTTRVSGNTLETTESPTFDFSSHEPVTRYSTTIKITCSHDRPEVSGLHYNADLICADLGRRYGVTCGLSDSLIVAKPRKYPGLSAPKP